MQQYESNPRFIVSFEDEDPNLIYPRQLREEGDVIYIKPSGLYYKVIDGTYFLIHKRELFRVVK